MDYTQFTNLKPGVLVPITTRLGHADHAFVPNALPGDWRMNPKLWPLVCDARDHVGRLEQIKGILPNPALLLRPLQRREAIHSSMLEGTYTTAEQLLLYEHTRGEGNDEPTSNREIDNQEVFNYYEALRQGHNWIAEGKPISAELTLQLHRILMTGVRGKDKTPGVFRSVQANVGSGRKFIPPPPDPMNDCLAEFLKYLSTDDPTFDPLVRAFVTHYQFEAIHPFVDGNGRVGRLLLALCVAKWCRLSMPWLYLSEYFDQYRSEYVMLLFRVSSHGEWDEWIEYCLRGTLQQASVAIVRCTQLKALRDAYKNQVVGHGERMLQIIEMLFESPIVRASEIKEGCGVSYETARVDIKKLTDLGILEKLERRYPQTFAAREVLRIAYGDS